MEIDPTFGLPLMPTDVAYNPGGTKIINAILLVMIIAAYIYSIWVLVKKRDWMPLAISIGAAFICIPEVFVDVLGCVYYPTSPEDIAFTILGRQMGWFIVFGWCGYGAVVINMFYRLLQSDVKVKTIWLSILGAAGLEIVIEEFIMYLGGIYVYYGNQPLVLLYKLPWWWIPCNVGGAFLAACIAHAFASVFTGFKALAQVVITPCAMGAGYALIALPSWIVVNGEFSWIVTQTAGILTILLGISAFAMEIKLFTNKNPFDFKSI